MNGTGERYKWQDVIRSARPGDWNAFHCPPREYERVRSGLYKAARAEGIGLSIRRLTRAVLLFCKRAV